MYTFYKSLQVHFWIKHNQKLSSSPYIKYSMNFRNAIVDWERKRIGMKCWPSFPIFLSFIFCCGTLVIKSELRFWWVYLDSPQEALRLLDLLHGWLLPEESFPQLIFYVKVRNARCFWLGVLGCLYCSRLSSCICLTNLAGF